ncbi:hypothetical protein Fcan01_26135 [Folsomia candida]|uniref:Reverse transcriptase domain-containing protein n=1 Tax=Folsomia candida TaxID=158441 RepID=A0A226D2R9_FOLCA|nr:hypothetical protein Fcan01_26135 [Folsomia candida]
MCDTAATIELRMMNMELTDNQKNNIRTGVAKIMSQNMHKEKIKQRWETWIKNSIKSLLEDETICITKADKGNSVVIMDRNKYMEKMSTMIRTGPYTILNHDPTPLYAKLVAEKCQRLTEMKLLPENLLEKNPRSPIIYGAPKIHKKDIPLRPIVDYRCSPTYKLSKYLANILTKVASHHEYTIKNSTEFVEELKKKKSRFGDKKVSFDVTSLFTMVPIPETLDYIKERLESYPDLEKWTSLPIDDIMSLLKLCTSSSYFQFQNNYYKQNDGTAMGSPLSPVIAEFFLQKLELTKIKNNRSIYFWKRYVDDVFCIARSRNQDKILQDINSFHPSIQFTVEEEINGRLPFLDIVIYSKNDSSLGHFIHRKPTQTCQYLNFRSFHPRAHKIGVIDTLLTRAIRLSDDEHVNDEIELTKIILMKNEYPPSLINDRLVRVKNKCLQAPNNKKDEEIKPRFILPWAGDVTSKIASYLRNKMDVDIGYHPGPKIGSIVCNAKQKFPKPRAGVYSIQCNSCPAVYIGETERDFMIRIAEHQNDIRRGSATSPVAIHMLENDHQLDTNSFKLIVPENRKFFRKFKEALHIKNLPNKINISNGLNVNPIWCSTLLNFL